MARRDLLIGAAALALLGGVGALLLFSPQGGPAPQAALTCVRDEAIPAAERAAIGQAATRFVTALATDDPGAAFAGLTASMRAKASVEQIAAVTQRLRLPQAPSAPQVTLTYRVSGSAPRASLATCQTASPGVFDTVVFGSAAKQAHVVVTDRAGAGERAFTLWLELEGGAWRVNGFSQNPSRIAGRDGAALWAAAREQRRRRHDLNAAYLYDLAEKALDRGPYFKSAALIALRRDRASAPEPAEAIGPSPAAWTLGGTAFAVLSSAPLGAADGKLGLVINRGGAWTGEAAATAANHALIDAFRAAHPEWTEAFEFIAVRAPIPGGGAWGSVYDKTGGYLKAAHAAP